MILCVSTFFIGLGGLIESVGARFKSDERAVEIMRLARQAIGGEQNIKSVQGLTIKGNATKIFEFDNISRVEKGEWELNLQLPNKISKKLEVTTENFRGATENLQTFERKVNVAVTTKGDGTETFQAVPGQNVVIVTKDENGNVLTENITNTNGETGKIVIGERANAESFHKNELFRTMISLFLTTPNNADAEYKFVGEQDVDGTNCEIVQVNSGNLSVKLYLNKSSHLPVMMSYTDTKPFMFRVNMSEANTEATNNARVIVNKPTAAQMAEYQVKFSDYRAVGGLQLPFKWTQTMDGKANEAIEVLAYELNPANIAEKFKEQPQRIMIRTQKP